MWLDDLKAKRDGYAAELCAQAPPADTSWNEYEEFLLEQIRKLTTLIDAAEASAAAGQTEVVSRGMTD